VYKSLVLCLFTTREFHRALVRDPVLGGLPVPGLLYADDLIILTLTADALRCLKRLKRYAQENCLTVNVKKSVVVVFGREHVETTFLFGCR
jgi:hypothetical protein